MKAKAIEAPRESPESFAALAAAVHPAWHQAIIRLANATQNVSSNLDLFLESTGKKSMRSQARELVESLINYLDLVEGDPDFEEDDREEVGDSEPSLGSFDRMTNQEKSWRALGWEVDAEEDDCDREDDDPNEEKQQPLEMGA